MPMRDMLKKKNMQRKTKAKRVKKKKKLLNMVASVFLGNEGSYRMYFEGDSPHKVVMIVCECM